VSGALKFWNAAVVISVPRIRHIVRNTVANENYIQKKEKIAKHSI
jgi:hypothetical protein